MFYFRKDRRNEMIPSNRLVVDTQNTLTVFPAKE